MLRLKAGEIPLREVGIDRKVSITRWMSPIQVAILNMSEKTRHVKVRCVECKAKFDSKYDAFDTSVITNVGQELQNFIFCQRCGKRVSVVVFDIR